MKLFFAFILSATLAIAQVVIPQSDVDGLPSSLNSRAPVNGPVWSGSQTIGAYILPKPDGVNAIGQTTIAGTVVLDFDVPTSNPGSAVGLVQASPAGAFQGVRSLSLYISTTGELKLQLYGATNADSRAAIVSGFRSAYSGQRVRLIIEPNAGTIECNGTTLTTTETTGGGTPPAWTDAKDFTRLDAGSLGTSGYPATGYNRPAVLLGTFSTDEKAAVRQGRPLPRWCYPLLAGESGAGTQKITGDNSTFASDTGWWSKTNATIAGGVGTFSAMYGTLVRNSILKAGLVYAVRATTTGSVHVWGGTGSEAILTSGVWSLLAATGANLSIVGYSVGATADDFEIVPCGVIAEQCRSANVSAGELTWPDTVGGVWVMPSTGWIPAVRPAPTSATVQGALFSRGPIPAVEFSGGVISGTNTAKGTADFEVMQYVFLTAYPSSYAAQINPVATNSFGFAVRQNGTISAQKYGVGYTGDSSAAIPLNKLTLVGYRKISGVGYYSIDGVDCGTCSDSYDYSANGTGLMGQNLPTGSRLYRTISLNTTLTATERRVFVETGQLPARVYIPGGAGVDLITGDASTFASDNSFWTKSSATIGSGTCTISAGGYILRSDILGVFGNKYRLRLTGTGTFYLTNGGGVVYSPAATVTLSASTGDIEFTVRGNAAADNDLLIASTAGGSLTGAKLVGLGVDCEMDPRWNGVGLQIQDVSGAGRHFTLPSSGVTPVLQPRSTEAINSITPPSGTLTVNAGNSTLTPLASGTWAINSVIPKATTDSAVFSAVPYGAISASNPQWFFGQRYSAQGPFSIWRYNGSSHLTNAVTVGVDDSVTLASTSTATAVNTGALKSANFGFSGNLGGANFLGGNLNVVSTGDVSFSASTSGGSNFSGFRWKDTSVDRFAQSYSKASGNIVMSRFDSSGTFVSDSFTVYGASNVFGFSDVVTQPGTFAEIYYADASTAQSIPTGTTYTKVTFFTANGESNDCTADAANDKITLTRAGRYRVDGSFSSSVDTNNTTLKTALFVGGSEVSKIHCQRKFSTATDSGSGSLSGIIDVSSVPVDIDIRVRHDQAGSVNVTGIYGNLNINRVGN